MGANLNKASFPVAKTSGGDPTLICLNPDGSVPVSSGTPGTCVKIPYACEDLTETAGVPDPIDVSEVTIATGEQYNCFEWSSSSNVDAIWEIVYVDDADGTPAETVLHGFITGPAGPSVCCKLDCLELDTTGGTGTQKVILRATAIDADCLGSALGCAGFLQAP